ncbi:MAG: response regulator [Mariprofundus sp.]|nr:response regulator [Mariprofundus sp.]
MLKNWEESNRYNEFKYKALDHAAAIEVEFEHVAKNVREVRFLIEHQINNANEQANNPIGFMPMAEKFIMQDSNLLSIAWAIRQTDAEKQDHLQIIYLKKSKQGHERISDLQVHDVYDEHVDSPFLLHQTSLLTSLVHQDTGNAINELNFIAPVADRIQSSASFTGKHLGSLIIEMNINGMIERALAKIPVSAQDISLQILHADGRTQAVYKHVSRSRTSRDMDRKTSLMTTIDFTSTGLHWQLGFEAAPKFLRKHPVVLAWQSLALCLFLTIFFVWYAYFTRKQTMLIQREVNIRTEALNQTQHKLRRIIDNLQDVYFQTNQAGLIQACSASIFDLLGYREANVIGSSIQSLHRDADVLEKLFTALQDSPQGKVFNFECESLHKDGHHIWTSSNVQFLYDSDQHISGIEGTMRDITAKINQEQEKEALQRQLEHGQRLESLGILAGGIAHYFNNILAAIMGNASLADHKVLQQPQESKVHLEKIIRASEKASSLCQQMLAYAGKARFVIEPINLSVLLGEITDLLEVSISPNVHIHYELQDDLPYINADHAQLQQLLMNFMTNANEAISEKGDIYIHTGIRQSHDIDLTQQIGTDHQVSADEYVYISFKDTGCGMDKSTLDTIFDPFFTTKFTGRGLGMSAVLGIIKGHQAFIQCDSKVGHGTTFTVSFPVAEQAISTAPETSQTQSISAQQHLGSVLVIDDDENIREVAQAMLEDAGWQNMSAADGESGIDIFRQHHSHIAAVILDMTMPGMNGLASLEALRDIDPAIKIIISSAYSEQAASQHFAGKNITGFLQKPYSLEQLQRQISTITAHQ